MVSVSSLVTLPFKDLVLLNYVFGHGCLERPEDIGVPEAGATGSCESPTLVLGTEARPCARALPALKHCAISPTEVFSKQELSLSPLIRLTKSLPRFSCIPLLSLWITQAIRYGFLHGFWNYRHVLSPTHSCASAY